MKTITVVKKEFLQNIRDYRIMFIMTLFPIILIYVVGMTFGGQYSSDIYGLESVTVDMIQEDTSDQSTLLTEKLVTQLQATLDLQERLSQQANLDDSLKRLSKNQTDIVIVVHQGTVTLYQNERYHKKFTVVEALVRSSLTTSTASEDSLAKNASPAQVDLIVVENKQYFNIKDYFALSFMVMFIMYGVSNPVTNTIREKKQDNANRILNAPVRKGELILGKILAYVLVNSMQMLTVFLATILFFGMNWGGHYVAILLMMVSLILVVVSFGIFLGFLFSSEGAAVGIVHTLIVLLAFFSGCYMPLSGLGQMGEIGQYFSPAWWSVEAGLEVIYGNAYQVVTQSIIINLVATLVLIILTWLWLSKKEVLQ